MIDLQRQRSRLVLSQLGRSSGYISSLGFDFSRTKIQHGSLTLTILNTDLGMKHDLDLDLDRAKRCLYHFYKDLDSLFFLLDSSDRDNMQKAREVFDIVLAEPRIAGVPVVVFDNKVDLGRNCDSVKLAECLGLSNVTGRHWFITASEAGTPNALNKGVDWMLEHLSSNQQEEHGAHT